MMRPRAASWGPIAVAIAASAMVMGAEPAMPEPFPPLPVPPIPRQAIPPYLARITISGDTKMTGVFENCVDLEAMAKSAEARANARAADAGPPMTGCTSAHEMRPGGSIHHEMSCDRAKGANTSFRIVSDGTQNDLRVHTEMYGFDAATGAPKSTVFESHMVRLGACPADLKPGQMRKLGGPIIDPGAASRLLASARGTPP